jgi:hypothetical protein
MNYLIIASIILLRLVLSNRLPAYLFPEMPHDDGWMFNKAQSIGSGVWLGSYNQYTLIKGVFSPIFLAICSKLGISFISLNTLIYCIGCLLFILAVRPIIKSKEVQIIGFVFLIFNPLLFALDSGQRIYRCGMGQWQILIIFSSIFAVILRYNQSPKSILKWAILSGLAIGAFFLTREDGSWIYPFVLSAIIFILLLINYQAKQKKIKVVIVLIIIAIPFFAKKSVAIVNYIKYGDLIANDRTDGFYAKVAGDLNLISPNTDDEKLYKTDPYKKLYFTIYSSTVEQAFAVSPTLNSAAKSIRISIQSWANLLHTKEPTTDHMLWALRDGVFQAGHYTSLKSSEAFFEKVHRELQIAFKNGLIKKRGFLISPLIAPLQKGDLVNSIKLMPQAFINIITFKNISAAAVPSAGSKSALKKMALFTGEEFISPASTLVCSGWVFTKDNHSTNSADLFIGGKLITKKLHFLGSDDVARAFNFQYTNAAKARFKIDSEILEKDNVDLVIKLYGADNKVIGEISPSNPSKNASSNLLYYHFDEFFLCSEDVKTFQSYVARANSVIGLYQKLVMPISLLAFSLYLFITIKLIFQINKKIEQKTVLAWFFMTALIFTFVLFILGMCIITTTSFNALGIYMYMAPAYILLLMFNAFALCWGFETIFTLKRSAIL